MALFYYPILIWVVAMQLLLYVSLLVFLAGAMFAAHWTRFRGNRDLYVFYVVLLWILAFIVGQFNYKILLHLGSLEVAVRYSSSLYVLIFTSILLVYILDCSIDLGFFAALFGSVGPAAVAGTHATGCVHPF